MGSTVELTWVDTISHDTVAYHLEFRPDATSDGVPIVSDLPPEQKSYEWTVPTSPCTECYLVVTQDNTGTDYSGRLNIDIVTELSVGGFAGASGTGGSVGAGGGVGAGGAGASGGAAASGGTPGAGGVGAAGSGGAAATGAGGGTGGEVPMGSGGENPASGGLAASGGSGGEMSSGCAFSRPGGSFAGLTALLALLATAGFFRRNSRGTPLWAQK